MKRQIALVSCAAAMAAASAVADPFASTADRIEFLPSGEFVHIFLGTSEAGSITFPNDVTARTLVVGGGGAGGYHSSGRHGGGGGAGGFLESESTALAAGTYTISVGAGAPGVNNGRGTNGGDSFIADTNGTDIVRAKGGGGGGRMRGDAPTVGGSGGGGAASTGANGTAGQGNKGGTGTGVNNGNVPQAGGGGGGGGAGAAGGDSNVPIDSNAGGTAGAGGIGKASDITGVRTWYAGGGGGGVTSTDCVAADLPGMGGQGGGGQGGGYKTSVVAQSLLNGVDGTGGGGGGGAGNGGLSGAGGSGIVAIRFSALDVDVGPISTNISLASASSGSLSFDGWFSPAGAEVYANVSDTAADGGSRIPLGTLASGGNQRIEVSGLAAEREYAISFELVDGQGRTSVSETVTASTTRSAEYPDAMVDASSISAGTTHAVVPWRLLQCGGESSIAGAAISYGTVEGLYPYSKTLGGIDAVGSYSSVIDGLQPSTTYYARLSIANSAGNMVERTFSFATAERIRISATPSGHFASYIDGTDRVIVFTNTAVAGALEVTRGGIADILVVGGGGAGGAFTSATALKRGGSGGGAGGFTYVVGAELAEGLYTVTVGAGGQSNTANSGNRADNGAPSSVSLGGAVVASALGGAGGQRVSGTYIDPGQVASGAGGTGGAGDPGTAGQGREGGTGNATRGKNDYSDDGIIGGCGGGGGAGAPGGASSAPLSLDDPAGSAGNGGDGLPCAITGAEAWYAGGGGGGVNGGFKHSTPGAGGRGGGGTGASYNSTTPEDSMNGVDGTGGGGGGGTIPGKVYRGGKGGSGIVIFRYADPDGTKPALSGFTSAAASSGVDLSFRIDSEGNGAGLDLRLDYGSSADSLSSSIEIDDNAYEGDCRYSPKGFSAGETYYARLVATADDGETWESEVFSFVPLQSVAALDSLVLQRTVTLRGQCLLGDGRTMTIRPAVLDGTNGYVEVSSRSAPESTTIVPQGSEEFSFDVTMPDFDASYDFAFIVENVSEDSLNSWTEIIPVGSATTRDVAVYTWRDVDGDWNGSWTDPAHWSSDFADCRGYPDSIDCTASFAPCTSTNCVVDMPAGTIRVFVLSTPHPANVVERTFTLRCAHDDGCTLAIGNALNGWMSRTLTLSLDNVTIYKTGDATLWCGDIVEISGVHGGLVVTGKYIPYGNTRDARIYFSIPVGGYEAAPVRLGSLEMTMKMRVEVMRDSPVYSARERTSVYPLVSLSAPYAESAFILEDQPFAEYTEMVVEYGKDDRVSLISARIRPLHGTLLFIK